MHITQSVVKFIGKIDFTDRDKGIVIEVAKRKVSA